MIRVTSYGPETCLLIPKTYNNENKKKLNIMKHMKRYTNEKLRDYKYGDPMGAALVIIEITKEYIDKVEILLQNAGMPLRPAMKKALIKDLIELINEL